MNFNIKARAEEVLKMKVQSNVMGLRYDEGSEVPADGTGGYAPTCEFAIVSGSNAGKKYINEGTYESCAFKQITTST